MAKPRLVFFGNERIATAVTTTAPTLQGLINAGYDVVAVVSNARPATSRKARPLEIEAVAAAHGIPLLLPTKPGDITDQLHRYQAEAGILVAYGRIIPQTVIDLFPHGIINIHPSLLPLHRGPTPLEQVILEGATQTGVSIMALAQRMDAGPVYAQATVNLTGHESKQALADHLLQQGADLLLANLPGILGGSLAPTPQNDTRATYDQLIAKAAGFIDWTKPATQIEREIRAYLGWPGSYTTVHGTEAIITAAHIITESRPHPGQPFLSPSRDLAISCGQDALVIDRLKPVGKREMTGSEFLAGHPLA